MIVRSDGYTVSAGIRPETHSNHHAAMVRRHWLIYLGAITACLSVALSLYFMTEPRYTARTDIVVVAVSDLPVAGVSRVDVSIDSAVQVLLSDQVLGEAARALDYPGRSSSLLHDMTISPLINSRILRIYVSSQKPEQAYNATTSLANYFLDSRRNSLESGRDIRIKSIEAQMESIDVSLEQLDSSVALTDDDAPTTRETLTTEQAILRSELTALSIANPEPGYISHLPTIPEESARAGLPIYTGSAIAVGLILASVIAFLRDRKSQRFLPDSIATDRNLPLNAVKRS